MDYVFKSDKAVEATKVCVTTVLHIRLMSQLPLSELKIPDLTQNPEFQVYSPEFRECHCLAVKKQHLPVVICSEFWVCLLGSAWIQSAFISGILISFDRFSLACRFLVLASWIPGWSILVTSCYASHPHLHASSFSICRSLTFCLWYSQNLSHIKMFPWKPKQRGHKACAL